MRTESVKGYEGLYEVTESGDVFTLGKGSSNFSLVRRKLKPFLCGKLPNRYMKVRLYRDGVKKDFPVHRIVAEAFLANPLNLPQVNHKDENPANNSVENLEWCTGQYNKEYSSSKSYKLISPNGEEVSIFNLSKFCRDNGLSNGCLYNLLSGKYSQHKGWTRPQQSL